MKLSCGIVRDLLPLYLDGAAGEESAEAVREHLEDCEECRTIHDRMKTETLPCTAEEREMEEVMKGIRRKMKMKHFAAAGLAVLTVLAAVGLFWLIFYRGFPADSSDVQVKIERQESDPFVVHLTLENGKAMNTSSEYTWKDGLIASEVIRVYEVPATPFFHQAPGCTFGVPQEWLDLPEPYILTIVYGDKTVTYHVEDEAEKLN